ncbi:MAG: C69 family dipeptidase [Candidatus Krumholzibacteriota bacterium]|nr:C69 family dipeptidase [Candidatus Krumholzibacteriota bacterium]
MRLAPHRASRRPAAVLLAAVLLAAAAPAAACTNLLVTRGASADGSTMITYTCDGEFHPHLDYTPAADHDPDSLLAITHWGGEVLGEIEQVPHTYAVVGLMNEHQLVIGETTFTGREELQNPDGILHYWTLMRLALQRAKTAREAVRVMTELVAQHGYRSTGESFSIADPDEVWYMEMIGPGPGGEGALWVARRVPDGYVCAHANTARIGEFPLDDRDNCLYEPRVIDFAVEHGFYDPGSGQPFRFNAAYCPADPKSLRYCATRVWSLLRRVAPSRDWPADYHRGIAGAEPYPLWIKPDEKLSVADVFALMRDHYEGTDYDMTRGVDAGPFGTPYRWRPMGFEVDGVEYTWERAISTQQTGFSWVSQSRRKLPDAVGGLLWYGVDDTWFTCYVPLYCGIDAVPESFARGRLGAFDWDSAWWVFNFVSNFTNLKYSYMIEDVQTVQRELEGDLLALQPAVEETAARLLKGDPDLARRYLTDYCVSHGEMVVDRWRALGEHLVCKYNDGYVKDEEGEPQAVGYPESWLREVLRARPEQFKLPVWKPAPADSTEEKLPY